MNTKLITQTFIGPVNIPYRRRREKFARHKVQRRTNIPRRTNRKGYYTGRAELVTSPAIKDDKVLTEKT